MSSLSEIEILLKKGKKAAASQVHAQFLKAHRAEEAHLLNQFADYVLDPKKNISANENLELLKWLISAGRNPDDFAKEVKQYDTATTCGLVWIANFVAYRCRTCGISPCMSLCAECFQNGNHEGHDFNMFRSQAGGACDCGDASVMKESGFCVRHGPKPENDKPQAPFELLCIAKALMPKMFFRLLVQLRKNNSDCLREVDGFITSVLNHLTEMGAAMRRVICETLIDPKVYSSLAVSCDSNELDVKNLLVERYSSYLLAKRKMHNFKPPSSFYRFCSVCHRDTCAIKAFDRDFIHKTFVEELLFWTIVYEFPQKLVCFLLNMLPDAMYKEAFAEAFVYHYSRVSMMLARFRNGEDGVHHSSKPSPHDLLSNCVVHVSVQLFSNEALAAKLCERQHLLHVIIASLRATIEGTDDSSEESSGILIKSVMQDRNKNKHLVVKCDHYIMKKHSYWPLVSDLNNILTHAPVANMFMSSCELLDLWLEFILVFQSMNLNEREMNQHVEYENDSYYGAFSAELEICATPMWTLISQLKDSSSSNLTKQVVLHTQRTLENWFKLIGFSSKDVPHPYQATFHIPLHRYYAIFLHHGVQHQGLSLDELLPSDEEALKLYLAHPLQVQISFYEILCGLWVRNGLQMKGQAMTYIQCHFCNSLVDPDLFLIQQCASRLDPDWFVQTVFERFHVWDWLSLSHTPEKGFKGSFLEPDQVMGMLESALTFLATLFSLRTNLGMNEEEIVRQEMVTLLAMGDRTHSQLMDLLPEKCGTSQNKEFEPALKQIAEYRGPTLESGGNLSQGMFSPKPQIWEEEYDPLHVLLRAVHRRDYQSSLDRFSQFVKQAGKLKSKSSQPWPPYRIPKDPDTTKFCDPRKILHSKVLHGALFAILYKAVHVCDISDQVLSLAVFLLEMSLRYPNVQDESPGSETSRVTTIVLDKQYKRWFSRDTVLGNMDTVIQTVIVNHENRSVAVSQLLDGTPAVEEMEIDIHSSDDESYPEYMSAEEDFDVSDPTPQASGVREIEPGSSTPQLPSANVPLALPEPPPSVASTALVPSNYSVVERAESSSVSRPTSGYSSDRQRQALPGPSTSPQQTNSSALVALLKRNQINRRRMVIRRKTATTRQPEICGSSRQPDERQDPRLSDNMLVTELIRALPPSDNADCASSLVVNESLLSLLLKLHHKLDPEKEPCNPESNIDESRIGDGAFFVKKAIRLYCKLVGPGGVKAVKQWQQKIWPPKVSNLESSASSASSSTTIGSTGSDSESNKASDDRDERRRKAKERQQKLMAEFASKQKAFLKAMNETLAPERTADVLVGEQSSGSTSSSGPSFLKAKTYECVICGQTTPSTVDRLVGIVVLLQSTSVLGHAQPDVPSKHYAGLPLFVSSEKARYLPCSDEDAANCRERPTLASYMEQRIEEFSEHFDPSWLNSLNIGWKGGVHVQSCGHYIHLDCHTSYIQSLRDDPQQPHNRHGVEQGEFSCPLCRQMANTVLPVNPDMGHHGAVVKCRPNDVHAVALELMSLLDTIITPDRTMLQLLFSFTQDLTKATGPQYKNLRTKPTNQSLFLFMCSIARTNLECELLMKLGKATPTGAKKSCFVSLFHCLAMDVKVLIALPCTPLWSQLTGLPLPENSSLSINQVEVPLLLSDTCALLIQIFFALPLNVDKAYYTCVIQMLYNLNFIQAVAQLTCLVTDEERVQIRSNSFGKGDLKHVNEYFRFVLEVLASYSLYSGIDEDDHNMPNKLWSTKELIEGIKGGSVPFLRIAALLQSHLYKDHFPNNIADDVENEYTILCHYLGIQQQQQKEHDGGLVLPHWIVAEPLSVITTWLQHYGQFVNTSPISARKLLRNKPIRWKRPALLRLPKTYDQLFLHYNCRQCQSCKKIPKEPCICLVCGTLVCMREPCCRTNNSLEACVHAEVCGAGTAIYLAVNSSTIIVIRGKRACVWGSVYLDAYGEEDKDLKRGKPLYLCVQRYSVLEQQWLTHSFDHTNKRWVWHKDTL